MMMAKTTDFLAKTRHDFATPLNTISTLVSLMTDASTTDKERALYFDLISMLTRQARLYANVLIDYLDMQTPPILMPSKIEPFTLSSLQSYLNGLFNLDELQRRNAVLRVIFIPNDKSQLDEVLNGDKTRIEYILAILTMQLLKPLKNGTCEVIITKKATTTIDIRWEYPVGVTDGPLKQSDMLNLTCQYYITHVFHSQLVITAANSCKVELKL